MTNLPINPNPSRTVRPTITLESRNQTLAIGGGIPTPIDTDTNEIGFIHINSKTNKMSIFTNGKENDRATYIFASPTVEGIYNLRNSSHTIEVGSLSPKETKTKMSIVEADFNDKIKLVKGTTIGKVTAEENGLVSIEFVNTRKKNTTGEDISNIVKVVAKQKDMLHILQSSAWYKKSLPFEILNKLDELETQIKELNPQNSSAVNTSKSDNASTNPEQVKLNKEVDKLGTHNKYVLQRIEKLRNKGYTVEEFKGTYTVKKTESPVKKTRYKL